MTPNVSRNPTFAVSTTKNATRRANNVPKRSRQEASVRFASGAAMAAGSGTLRSARHAECARERSARAVFRAAAAAAAARRLELARSADEGWGDGGTFTTGISAIAAAASRRTDVWKTIIRNRGRARARENPYDVQSGTYFRAFGSSHPAPHLTRPLSRPSMWKPLELRKIDKSPAAEQFVYSAARLRANELEHITYSRMVSRRPRSSRNLARR
jgi:hypothetical protein